MGSTWLSPPSPAGDAARSPLYRQELVPRRKSPWLPQSESVSCSVTSDSFCHPMDHSPPGSSVHGIFQARILEWLPFPPPGGLPDPGIKLRSLALQVDSLPSEPSGKPVVTGCQLQTQEVHCQSQNHLSLQAPRVHSARVDAETLTATMPIL